MPKISLDQHRFVVGITRSFEDRSRDFSAMIFF